MKFGEQYRNIGLACGASIHTVLHVWQLFLDLHTVSQSLTLSWPSKGKFRSSSRTHTIVVLIFNKNNSWSNTFSLNFKSFSNFVLNCHNLILDCFEIIFGFFYSRVVRIFILYDLQPEETFNCQNLFQLLVCNFSYTVNNIRIRARFFFAPLGIIFEN